MSSEITLTKQEQERIVNLAASFPIESGDIPALRDAIEYDVKRHIEKALKRRQEFFADPDAYERGIRP
jgi:hypothetical protein